MNRLENKIALVTGAAMGMGRAITHRIVKEGAQVVITDINLEGLQALQEELECSNSNYKGFFKKMDVTKNDEIEKVISKTIDTFGRIDILVNCAGILSAYPIVDLPEEEWDAVMNVNAKGTYLIIKNVAKEMKEQKYGKICCITSIVSKKATIYHAHYCASKFAVRGIIQSSAIELAPYGINVNCICPGEVDTGMLETSYKYIAKYEGISFEEQRERGRNLPLLKRFEKPEDVAPLVAFLVSDESGYITGQSINICGGIQFH